jgi:HEAT repeat protein
MIDPLFFVVAPAIATVAAMMRAVLSPRSPRTRVWKQAATVAQLTDVTIGKDWAGGVTRLTGRWGGLSVRLEGYHKSQRGTRIVISGFRQRAQDLSFRREGLGTRLDKAIGSSEITLGDPVFDQAVYLQGSPELARALFDATTRRLVRRLVQGEYTVSSYRPFQISTRTALLDGELRIELETGPLGQNATYLWVILPEALLVAERLVQPEDLGARLAENLRDEPMAEVRLKLLQTLLERHRRHPSMKDALLGLLKDESTEVRVQSALALGVDGWPTLLEIASNDASDDRLADRSIRGLGTHLSTAQAREILMRALRLRRTATARACLASLGLRQDPEVTALLARVLALDSGEVAATAARALVSSAGPAAEAALLSSFGGHDVAVLTAVAEGLGRVGTAAAVMPLREAADRVADDGFRRTARQAVAAIQGRLTGAAPGQLSLAAGQSGQVTMVDEARGELSLAEKKPERP